MSDWLFIAGPQNFRPSPIEWRQKIFYWDDEAFPQEEEGFIGDLKVCSVQPVQENWPILRHIPHNTKGWFGLMFMGPFVHPRTTILDSIVSFAAAQPDWFFDCELNAYSEQYIIRSSDAAELRSIVESVLTSTARNSFVLWSSLQNDFASSK